jgi:hypothetical protein
VPSYAFLVIGIAVMVSQLYAEFGDFSCGCPGHGHHQLRHRPGRRSLRGPAGLSRLTCELLPAVRDADEGATVLADGFSCRTQLRQLAHRDGIRLAELLARSIEDGPGARRYPR